MKKVLINFGLILVVTLALLSVPSPRAVHAATGPRCYVNASAGGATHDGNSWTTAFNQLYEATNLSVCTEIWVAAGFYTQNLALAGTSGKFWVSRNLTMYGGFAGGETDLSQRNIAANATILSGDSDLNDTNSDGNHIDETVTDIQPDHGHHVSHHAGRVHNHRRRRQ
jgi:hypothetical protein